VHIRMRARTREHIHERTVQPVPGEGGEVSWKRTDTEYVGLFYGYIGLFCIYRALLRMCARTHERVLRPVPGGRWGCVVEIYRRRICRALLRICGALVQMCRALWRMCGDFWRICRALLWICRAR